MPKVIDQAVKTQIIELYKQGRGRNDIAEAEGVKGFASSGTVSSVIMQYKQQISSESVKELRPDTTIAGLENGVYGAEKEIQTPQTKPRSEQLSVEIEEKTSQKKEQVENDIVILDAELLYMEDRIDEGYRVIGTYKKIAADFSVVKSG